MQLKSDVLPDPLGPMRARISPSARWRLTPARASIPPKRRRRSRTSRKPGKALSEERGEGLVGREHLGRLGGAPRAQEANGVEAVVAPGPEGDPGPQAFGLEI